MQTVDDLLKAFGGPKRFADIMALSYNTVLGFNHRGSIPPKYWKTIVAFAQHDGIEGIDLKVMADIAVAIFPEPKIDRRKKLPPREERAS